MCWINSEEGMNNYNEFGFRRDCLLPHYHFLDNCQLANNVGAYLLWAVR